MLVLALLLLLVLTTLAISGIGSSSLEMVMAGNGQAQSSAFQAAETGINSAVIQGTFDPSAVPQVLQAAVPNSATDAYTVTIAPALGGAPQPALWGSSANTFSTYHFDVASTGTSVRGSSAVHNQGIAVIAPATPNYGPLPGSGSTQLN